MSGWHCRIRHLGIGLCVFVSMTTEGRADPLFSVATLGPANPGTSLLNRSSAVNYTSTYLNGLSPTDQAAFQAGSFDVFAHPANTNVPRSFSIGPQGWDIVATNLPAYVFVEPAVISQVQWTTGNNLGVLAGTGYEDNMGVPGVMTLQTVMFKPIPM
jgi:hypothetical protein